jgi:hypothetical protein
MPAESGMSPQQKAAQVSGERRSAEAKRRKVVVTKRAVYGCGCERALTAPQGQRPRPPLECPDHGDGWVRLESLDPQTGMPL